MFHPSLTIDQQANAAFLKLADGKVGQTVPVNDGDRVVATLSFLDSGELQGIELLDAKRQIPNVEEFGA